MKTLAALVLMLGASIYVTGCNKTGNDKAKTDEAKPKPSGIPPKEKEAMESAIKSLMKLESLTKTGLNYTEYSTRMLDTKVEFDLASERIPNTTPIRPFLMNAMAAFSEARDYWKHCQRDKRVTDTYVMNQYVKTEVQAYYSNEIAELTSQLNAQDKVANPSQAEKDAQSERSMRIVSMNFHKDRLLDGSSVKDVEVIWCHLAPENQPGSCASKPARDLVAEPR